MLAISLFFNWMAAIASSLVVLTSLLILRAMPGSTAIVVNTGVHSSAFEREKCDTIRH
jgi:hypothetical protein